MNKKWTIMYRAWTAIPDSPWRKRIKKSTFESIIKGTTGSNTKGTVGNNTEILFCLCVVIYTDLILNLGEPCVFVMLTEMYI